MSFYIVKTYEAIYSVVRGMMTPWTWSCVVSY